MTSHPTDWLPLTPGGDLSKWWIDTSDGLRVDGDTLVFTGPDVRAEVGGMSWDDYVLSADVILRRRADNAYFQVELTAAGTCVYCQLLPDSMVLAHYSDRKRGTAHFGSAAVKLQDDVWHTLQMKAQQNYITAALDGHEIVTGKSPHGTKGMPGVVVKAIRNAEPRLRNIRIQFLSPTAQQLEEYRLDASTNWKNYENSQRIAQQPNAADS
ncbi:MAG: hypothetical protein JW889_04815 [Verrucomicrobia bacterium]|nr:hypothetical protein [Verrucomicrobiota bacterium]